MPSIILSPKEMRNTFLHDHFILNSLPKCCGQPRPKGIKNSTVKKAHMLPNCLIFKYFSYRERDRNKYPLLTSKTEAAYRASERLIPQKAIVD